MKIYKWMLPVLLFLTSCHVIKDYQKPIAPTNSLYRQTSVTDSLSISAIPWKDFFKDESLRKIIQEGMEENLDLKIAFQRIQSAKASLSKAKQAFLPELDATFAVKAARLPYTQGFGFVTEATQYDVSISTSWEVDVWGRIASGKRAAVAELMATQEFKRAVQTNLVAEIATNYVYLLSLDDQLELLRRTTLNRAEDVVTMLALNASNRVNGAAVVQSQANQIAARIAIPDVERQVRETENALCILLNRTPGPVIRGKLSDFTLPLNLNTGVPAELLENRPDIKQAELGIRAAFENINVAQASFYPALKITSTTGFSSFDFSKWLSPVGFLANITGGLTRPILARGENKARLRVAHTLQQEALWRFRKKLLVAGQEVSDALFLIETAEKKITERIVQLDYLNRSVEFTKELMKYNSSTNYTDVLTSQQNLLYAQNSSINDRQQKWQGIINLYRALGGGWK